MRNLFWVLSLTITGSLLTSGCISHRMAAREPVVAVSPAPVLITEAPPAARPEVVGVAPDPNQVWVAGYWMRGDGRWIWLPGHWESRPRIGAIWASGEWTKTADGRGWVWTPGHWE